MPRPLRLMLHALLWLAVVPGLVGAQPAAPAAARQGQASHHRSPGFQNNYIEFAPKSALDLVRWQWNAARQGLPRPPSEPTPRVAPDLAFIATNAKAGAAMQPAVTWIGHATVLAQMGGLNLLTDPMFSERASPVTWAGPRRAQPPGLALRELPHIDVVLVSHNHYDHCDEASLRSLNSQPGGPPLFVVPLGLKAWLAEIGITQAIELDWWQAHRIGAVEIVLTPAQHWSGRGLFDRMSTLWGGFAVFAPELHLLFAGDTGYSKDFTDIAQRFAARQGDAGFDIALIPIGTYEPRWFMAEQHVDPLQSVRIHMDVRARQSIGIHWGSFAMSDEPLDQPPVDMAVARRSLGLEDREFFVLPIGATHKLPRRGTAQ